MLKAIAVLLSLLLLGPQLSLAAAPENGNRIALRAWEHLDSKGLKLRSKAALVQDKFGNSLYAKDADSAVPIASITKLMTAMVVLDSRLSLDEVITIDKQDRDLLRLTGSRLKVGARLSRKELLLLALMSSENRAAMALGRSHPGGTPAFVRAMNAKAKALGMHASHFVDPAGLDAGNVASARNLATMVQAAVNYPLIHEATTREQAQVRPFRRLGPLQYVNTNRLVRNDNWEIDLSKTGYINEAGRCLVMQARVHGTPVVMVFLNSYGKLTPFGDANRARKWLDKGIDQALTQASAPPADGV